MKEIARIAGTSLSTVSRSLNDNPAISEKTRTRIKEIAANYNFEFNMSARSLATKRNSTIGVIFPEALDNPDNASYAGLLLRNIRAILEEASLDTLVSFTVNQYTGESNLQRLLRQGKVDGLLLIQPNIEWSDYALIQESQLPFVLLHFLPEGLRLDTVDYVYTDHVLGGKLATEHLLRSGCRRILCITERERQFKERTEGYRQAHRAHELPVYEHLIHSCDASFEAGYQALLDNRESLTEIDAVFAQADITALGVLAAARELGIRIPEDLPLVGYDDIRMAQITYPRLTTVHQPQETLVRIACRRLVELLSRRQSGEQTEDGPLQRILEPSLVVRDTAPAVAEQTAPTTEAAHHADADNADSPVGKDTNDAQ